ncbi:DUF6627 family protein, partial [Acinetobacter baumannii]|uniref:DUF6627 family protein n=1 Tax=Acinetobacter baumannii TaxID=470 RepID=UPI000AD6AFDA
MFTSPLLKRIATVLAALHILLVAQIPMAQAAMIGTPEVVAEHQQQVDRQHFVLLLDGALQSWLKKNKEFPLCLPPRYSSVSL